MAQIILVFGALGDPNSSVVGLYKGLLQKLSSTFHLVAIDPLCLKIDAERRAQELQINYVASYPDAQSAIADFGPKRLISAAFVLTPVNSHLEIIEQLEQLFDIDKCLIVVEKPAFALHEIKHSFQRVVVSLKEKGTQFYFIDTAFVAASLEACFNNGLVPRCAPNKIVALASDNPLIAISSLHDFCFQQRLKFLNQRQLLNLSSNGGAGYGFDMGIHAIAGLMRFLQKAGINYQRTVFEQRIFEALKHPGLLRDEGAETHCYSIGTLQCGEFDIPFSFEAGKAGDTWDRRIELYYDELILVIGFGTLRHYPYVWLENDSGEQLQHFEITGSGYSQHFNDILSILNELHFSEPLISCEQSETLMRQSMLFFEHLYDLAGQSTQTRESNIKQVETHRAQLLSERETQVRARLQVHLDTQLLITS